MKSQSPRLFSATQFLSDSLSSFLLLSFNFRLEENRCVLALMVSVELLLKERRAVAEPEKKSKKEKLCELINDYKSWNNDEKNDMHSLRKRGNAIKHRGEEQDKELPEVLELLKSIYPLVGSLYSELGHEIDENFSIYERCILKGKNPPWYALADSYSSAALRYTFFDEEITVDIANEAYETAVRGFAGSWRIEGSDTLALPELEEVMDQHEEEEAHSYYWDESIPRTRDQLREIGESQDTGFRPPYTIHQIPFQDDRHESLTQRTHYYAREIREIVLSYLDRFPLLDLTDCLRAQWNFIVEEMKQVAPNVDAPRTNPEIWYTPLTNLEIVIPVEKPKGRFMISGLKPSDIWKDEHLDHFKRVLERVCGELPEGLRF